MKTCFKCHRELPMSEFYVHRQMADGHLNKCKDCTKRDTADRVSKLSVDPHWLDKELERHRLKSRRYRDSGKGYVFTAEQKEERARRYAEKYPKRVIANRAVSNAVRDGRLLKLPCSICGNEDSEGHHDDYDKPLEVIWLCPKHHAERHVELRRKERLKQIC